MTTTTPKKKRPQNPAPHGFRSERQMRLFLYKAVVAGVVALIVLHSYQISGTFFAQITGVLKTVFLSIFLGLIFVPFLNAMNKYKIPDWGGILIIYIVLFGLFSLMVVAVFPMLSVHIDNLSTFITTHFKDLSTSSSWSDAKIFSYLPESFRNEELGELMSTLQANFADFVKGTSEYITGATSSLIDQIKGLTNFIVQIVLIFTFTFFFALERHKMHDFLHELLPRSSSKYLKKREIDMIHILFAWLRGQVILGFSIFLSTFAGLWLLHLFGIQIEQKFALAFIAGMTEFVPYLGPILALIPALLITLAMGWKAIIGVTILYFMIQRLENNILVPIVMSKSLDMSPFLVLLVMLIGANLLGIVGILIAVPVTSILSLFFRDWMAVRKQQLAEQ